MDPTVELSAKDERDWHAERQEEIAAICWQKCPDCNGQGFLVWHWEDEGGGPDHLLRPTCENCKGQGHIQLHDPLRVGALYDAADDAREKMGVECYTHIASALSLAIDEAVNLSSLITVKSASIPGKIFTITYPKGCDCYDSFFHAPMFGGQAACNHQIAVWLVKVAENKMAADENFIREERGYD